MPTRFVKTALVTGANGAIGEAIARGIAARGHAVILACRDEGKGRAALDRIRAATGSDALRLEIVDVGSRDSIAVLARRIEGPLEILINNAAIAPKRKEKTEEGIERQLAVNVLGYVRVVRALEAALTRAERPRVVNVASYWAGDLVVDDLEYERRRYDNDSAYRQSKQANRMLTIVDSERLAPKGIVVNSCHPGDVNSRLSNDLGFGGSQSAEQGAKTPIWLALDAGDQTGKYFADCAERTCQFAKDRAAIEALRARIEAY